MELHLNRFADAQDYTYGTLRDVCEKYPEGFTLEDEGRSVKVAGETRIPARRYELKLRKVLSGLTKKYRERFSWFKWHIEIDDVPGFDHVYIHIGNDDDDTDACVLIGNTCDLTAGQNGFIGESTDAYERFYKKVLPILESGERVWISIKDVE